ncbi:MAG: hypothetical protein OHK0022_48350 [Roseiflexaceae bacterium]
MAPIIGQFFYIGIGNYPSWDESIVPFNLLNRLYISNVNVAQNAAGQWVITYKNSGDDTKIATVIQHCRAKNPSAKILISSGDAGSAYISAAQNPEAFAASVASFVSSHGIDGYDMDWETDMDAQALNKLLTATRSALTQQGQKDGKTYLLTLDVWQYASQGAYDLATIANTVDQINIMSYGPDNPLNNCVESYQGFPVSKMIGGIETEANYDQNGGVDTLGTGGTIYQKCHYAQLRGLAGMMAWRIDNDYVQNGVPTFKGAQAMYQFMTEIN